MQRTTLTFRNQSAAESFVNRVAPVTSIVSHPYSDSEVFAVMTDIPSQETLLEAAQSADPATLVICPSCNSRHVEFPDRPENSPTMKATHDLLEKITPGTSAKFHCGHCEHAWTDL